MAQNGLERPIGHQRRAIQVSGCVFGAGRSVVDGITWRRQRAKGEKQRRRGRRDDRSPESAASDGSKPGLSSWKKKRDGTNPIR